MSGFRENRHADCREVGSPAQKLHLRRDFVGNGQGDFGQRQPARRQLQLLRGDFERR